MTKQEIRQHFFSYVSKNASLPKSLYRVSIIYMPTDFGLLIERKKLDNQFFFLCVKKELYFIHSTSSFTVDMKHGEWGIKKGKTFGFLSLSTFSGNFS